MAKGGITPFLLLFFLLVANQLPGATSLVPLNRPGVETASLIQYPFVIGSGQIVNQHPLTTTTMRRTAMTVGDGGGATATATTAMAVSHRRRPESTPGQVTLLTMEKLSRCRASCGAEGESGGAAEGSTSAVEGPAELRPWPHRGPVRRRGRKGGGRCFGRHQRGACFALAATVRAKVLAPGRPAGPHAAPRPAAARGDGLRPRRSASRPSCASSRSATAAMASLSVVTIAFAPKGEPQSQGKPNS